MQVGGDLWKDTHLCPKGLKSIADTNDNKSLKREQSDTTVLETDEKRKGRKVGCVKRALPQKKRGRFTLSSTHRVESERSMNNQLDAPLTVCVSNSMFKAGQKNAKHKHSKDPVKLPKRRSVPLEDTI